MKGKYRQKAKPDAFAGIDKELEKLKIKEEKDLVSLQSKLGLKRSELTFIMVLLVLTAALIAAFYYVSWQANSKNMERNQMAETSSREVSLSASSDDSSLSEEERKEKERLEEIALVPNKDDFEFKWNLKSFQELHVKDYKEISGLTLDEVVDKFGKAAELYYALGSLTLYYDWPVSHPEIMGNKGLEQSVHLTFVKIGPTYYLSRKEARVLNDQQFTAALEGQFSFNWKPEDISALTVGDKVTGQGGMTYQEVVERFSLPQFVHFLEKPSSLGTLILKASYSNRDELEGARGSIVLNFLEQEDGSYRLSQVTSFFFD